MTLPSVYTLNITYVETTLMKTSSLTFLLIIPLLFACQNIEKLDSNETESTGRFVATPPATYSIEMTRSDTQPTKQWNFKDNSVTASVTEEDWCGNYKVNTRVSGDDVTWNSENPDAAVYITDESGNALVYDIPLNPYNYNVYDKYDMNRIGNVKGVASSSKFFWTTDIWGADILTGKSVNFYGYYPRARDTQEKDPYIYKRNSVIDYTDSKNKGSEWYILDYNFYNQNDENLSHFDLMCSVSESQDNGNNGRYGNRSKNSSDNIQMPFEHTFSMLNFEIHKGERYEKECYISQLSVYGSQVFASGTLNLLTNKIEQKDNNATIIREIATQKIKTGVPFRTTMILQPSTDNPTAESKGRLVVSCTIDGSKYECDLSQIKLERGKKYNVKLTVNPSGIALMHIWNGARATIDGNVYESGEEHRIPVSNAGQSFTVSSDNGMNIQVIEDGKNITNDANSYQLNKNSTYNIVTFPQEWYITDNMRIQFDGKWNNKYKTPESQNKDVMTWDDLSGHDNNGQLQGFSSGYGWNGKGLVFDGDDDIVMFPGNINNGDYTIEMYIYVDDIQTKSYPRLIAEGIDYACFCLNKCKDSSTKTDYYRVSIYGNGSLDHNLVDPEIRPAGKLCQLDFVYHASEQKVHINMTYEEGETTHTVKKDAGAARNAKSITTASIGRRIEDTTRSLAGTYYSFILYDKTLTDSEISHNYRINKMRYSEAKH